MRPTDAASAREALLHIVRQAPSNYGYTRTRWTLRMLREVCADWLHVTTDGSMAKVLRRLGIHYKMGREYVHSPDVEYREKVAYLRETAYQVLNELSDAVLLYLDELSFYRQPTKAPAYEAKGPIQPRADQATGCSNTRSRVVGAMNAATGRVHFCQRSHINVRTFINFLTDVRAAYPQAGRLFIVLDNWPVHFHADVLARLEPQLSPFDLHLPGSWRQQPGPAPASIAPLLPIQLLPLPSYASWLNPIEKLWRYLKQEVIHMHRSSDDWQGLKDQVDTFLERFKDGSPRLLHYVGLLPA